MPPRTLRPTQSKQSRPTSGLTRRRTADASTTARGGLSALETHNRDRLAQLLAGFESIDGFYAKLDRLPRPGHAELGSYLGIVDFRPSFLTDVAGAHGGGKFRARIHDGDGAYRTSFTFTLAGAAIPRARPAPRVLITVALEDPEALPLRSRDAFNRALANLIAGAKVTAEEPASCTPIDAQRAAS